MVFDATRRFSDFDSLPIGIVVLDTRDRVRFWNRTVEEWSGIRWSSSRRFETPPFLGWTKEPFFLSFARSWKSSGVQATAEIDVANPFRTADRGTASVRVYLRSLRRVSNRSWTVVSILPAFAERSEPIPPPLSQTRTDSSQENEVQTRLTIALAEKEFLIREIHHRVKNNLNMIAGMISLKMDALDGDSNLRAPLVDLQQRIFAISQIHDLLYKSSELRLSSTGEYLRPLAEIIVDTLCENPNLTLETSFDHLVNINMDATILLGLMQTELLTNALKYAFSSMQAGFVRICLERVGSKGVYSLSHSGDTLPLDFHPEQNTGLGMLLMNIYSSQIKGTFSWVKADPTVFKIEFPL